MTRSCRCGSWPEKVDRAHVVATQTYFTQRKHISYMIEQVSQRGEKPTAARITTQVIANNNVPVNMFLAFLVFRAMNLSYYHGSVPQQLRPRNRVAPFHWHSAFVQGHHERQQVTVARARLRRAAWATASSLGQAPSTPTATRA